MSRFNQTVKDIKHHAVTTNEAGGKAYMLTPEYKLYSLVCNSMMADQYYRTADESLKEVIDLVAKCRPEYVGALADYARNDMHLRSMPVVLSVLLAKLHGGPIARRTVSRVVKRVDELTELLAFYGITNPYAKDVANKGSPHPIRKTITKKPNSLIRGIKDVFESGRFDEYQYGKYNREGMYTIRDALFLARPKPRNDVQKALFTKIANKQLTPPDTWEVALSAAGKDVTKKAQVWERLINEKKLGHMALLRNIRNILELKPSQAFIDFFCSQLVAGVDHGKQMPFRYYSAYRSLVPSAKRGAYSGISNSGHDPFALKTVCKALEMCMKRSVVQRIPILKGRSLVACDVSGSMYTPVSGKSQMEMYDIGLVLGASLYAANPNETLMGMFGDSWKFLVPTGQILFDVDAIRQREGEVGYATNGYKVIEDVRRRKLSVDNILMFTDGQMYGGDLQKEWDDYRYQINPNAKLFVFDLAGHGASPIRINNKSTYLIAGWSEKIFDTVDRLTRGENIVEQIMKYDSTLTKAQATSENEDN